MEKIYSVILAIAIFKSSCLAFCPHLCQCDDTLMVTICPRAAQLDVIPITLNPMIRTLVLQGNRIRTVDASLQFYGQLQNIDFSRNQLRQLPERCFAKQQKLMELQMDQNEIQNLTSLTFNGLKSLLRLSVRGNEIEVILEATFSQLSKLEYLDLGNNKISVLDSGAFQGLDHLQILKLDGNQLTSVPVEPLGPISLLIEFHLGSNGIQTIDNDAFREMSQLSTLDLTGANICNISEYAFRGANNLKILSLAKNALDSLPIVAFQSLHQLEELNLSQNFIEKIEQNSLPGLISLKQLDISNSQNLVQIASRAFLANTALKTLVLNGNKRLRMFDPEALTLISQNGTKLDISMKNMDLTGLDQHMVDWAIVGSLDLSGNLLHCDCNLRWLHALITEAMLNQNTTSISIKAICSTPNHLFGQNLADISDGALQCDSILATQSPSDRLLLISICVAAAIGTGLIVFTVAHCSQNKVECLCRKSDTNSDAIEDTSPYSNSPLPPQARRSLKNILCYCCCKKKPLTYQDAKLSQRFRGTLSTSGCYCCPGIQPTGISVVPTIDAYVDSATGVQHMYCSYQYEPGFNTYNTKSSYYDEEDYFLSLSKDMKMFKPIPVSEL